MKIKFLLLTAFLIIVPGCTPAIHSTEMLPVNSQVPLISTSTPIKELRTPSRTDIITPTFSVDHSLEECLPVETEKSTDLNSKGYLILRGYFDNSGNESRYRYKINMESKEGFVISEFESHMYNLAVSPNRKLMAYERLEPDDYSLIVEDALGIKKSSIPWKAEWDYIADWLTNENLLIGTTPESDKSTGKISSTFIVYNPFTRESQVLEPHFPNIYENHSMVASWRGWRETVYNQNLDRVAYLQTEPNEIEFSNVVLYDINRKRSLASFKAFGDAHAIPRWSHKGDKIAFATSININDWPAYELQAVNEYGQAVQLTRLNEYYYRVYIEDFAWSPDDKHIALWFSWWTEERPGFDLKGKRYLAIIDIQDKRVTNYCIQGKFWHDGRIPPPVWSPDGKQLAVESVSPEGTSRVVLIDLAKPAAVQIAEDLTPIGWMTAP